MHTSDFDYDLPSEYIAQRPATPRDASRLMVLDRASGAIQHSVFRNLGDFLSPGDLLVLNETRVIPARLFARKIPTGGRVEILLLNKRDQQVWETLVGGQGLRLGQRLEVDSGPQAEIVEALNGPRRLVRFAKPVEPYLEQAGHVPLPPYIHEPLGDPERYQTVYARREGSAAAPTAGLHFTPRLLADLGRLGVKLVTLTLHVGLDTFAPVNEEDPMQHHIHSEWCQVPEEAARVINRTRREGGRIVAVGTTSVRTLESAARAASPGETVTPIEGPTDLFILPGFRFKAVDALITNFHLPRSTLIMLVSAFAGRERILSAYEEAKANNYRFYSFGDAMLIR
jgi:S-adenosylmethionine:tRNA ribosyltransferase-isomerase